MDIYESTVNYISNFPVLKAWPESKILLDHAASKQRVTGGFQLWSARQWVRSPNSLSLPRHRWLAH